MAVDPKHIGIQTKRKEPTKAFQIETNPLVSIVYANIFQRCKG